MKLLGLETSGRVGSVALVLDGRIEAREIPTPREQTERLLPLVDELLRGAGLAVGDLDGIAFGRGPGSFTGLRIAAAVAQGLAAPRGLPLLPVSSLLCLAQRAWRSEAITRALVCVDAHMGEVYHAAYRKVAAGWEELSAPGLHKPDAIPVPREGGWTGYGDGFAAHRDGLSTRLGDRLLAVRPETTPTARAVLKLAIPRFAAGEAKDAATALPVYLRDKVALKTVERR